MMLYTAEGILLLHYHGPGRRPSVLKESTQAFASHSRFPVWCVDAHFGFPPGLKQCRFSVVLLHYSLFYNAFSPLDEAFREFIAASRESYIVAMFQDEQAYLPERIAFCDRYGIDCVYTALEDPHSKRVYETKSRRVVSYIPGYVSDQLLAASRRMKIPEDQRRIDIGYRGRRMPTEWGSGSQDKYEIGVQFRQRAQGLGLRLDIEMDEVNRIYGRAWYAFIANCKAVLGTESGVGALPWLLRRTGAEIATPELRLYSGGRVPPGWDTIPYRAISPRHFEAAALQTCQILYEGHYSGILRPMVHYIPLKKDFSNFNWVISTYSDRDQRARLALTAQRDLIESHTYTYSAFVADFDRLLEEVGAAPCPPPGERNRVAWLIGRPHVRRAAHITKTVARDYMWLAKRSVLPNADR